MQTWIPLTTSFLFLAVMWNSGVSEMRSASTGLELTMWRLALSELVTDEGFDNDKGMKDVPTVESGHNPLPHQRSNERQLVGLTLRA